MLARMFANAKISLWRVSATTGAGLALTAVAAAEPARLSARDTAAGAEIAVQFAEGRAGPLPSLSATVADGVLLLRFGDAVEAEVGALAGGAPQAIAFARADPEGRNVRVALRRTLTASVRPQGGGYVVTLSPAAAPAPAASTPPPAPAAPPESAPGVGLTISERPDRTRLTFRWPGRATMIPRIDGERVELRFSRPGDVDLGPLRATPPARVRGARVVANTASGLRVGLQIEPGVTVRHFVDGDRIVVDLLSAAPEATPPTAAAETPAEAAPAAPARGPRGAVPTRLVEAADATRIAVRLPAATKAAAFRRGESVWLLFDGADALDLAAVPAAGRRHRDVAQVRGQGVSGVRLRASADQQIGVARSGEDWVLTLSPRREAPPAVAQVQRAVGLDGRNRLQANFGRPGVVRWIDDPEVGDRLAVALVEGEPIGVAQRLATLEAVMLPAVLGAAVEPRADGVGARYLDGVLVVGAGVEDPNAPPAQIAPSRPPLNALEIAEENPLRPGAEAGRAALDTRLRVQELERRAAAEGVGQGRPVAARLSLARYLLERELAAEALAALRLAARNDETLLLDGDFRLMRAAANVMMGRSRDATADLSLGVLYDNPTAAIWRGIALAEAHRWAEARAELEKGAPAVQQLPQTWGVRYHLALAETALELNDIPAAGQAAAEAAAAAGPELRGLAAVLAARVQAASGDREGALAAFDALAKARSEPVAVRAALEAVRIRRLTNQISPQDAADILDGLRFRWRGDDLELQAVSTLAEAYGELGRHRDALLAMQAAANHAPQLPGARKLRMEMAALFARLFLEGEADRLEPIQALGLFYEFQGLTPVGPDGDRMVRLLAGRLVAVDLLEQAASLLQHQVDQRLEGMARAQVAGDLALVYLQDQKPDKALVALASTRVSNLPAEIVATRRLLEATALYQLARYDHALELLERDRSPEAQRLRADAAWKQGDWPRAGRELATLLSMRPPASPATDDDRQIILRAAIAATLAGDQSAVAALKRLFTPSFEGGPDAEVFAFLTGEEPADVAAVRDLARVTARTDLIDRVLQRLKAQLTAPATPPATPAAPPTAPPPAPRPPGPAPAPPAALPSPAAERRPEAAQGPPSVG